SGIRKGVAGVFAVALNWLAEAYFFDPVSYLHSYPCRGFQEFAMIEKRDFYIDERWVKPATPSDCEVIDPSTEEPCAVISLGGQTDTDKAVTAAKRAFEEWSRTE